MPSEMKLFVSYDASDLGVFLVCSCDTGVTVSFWPGSANFSSIYLFKFKFYFYILETRDATVLYKREVTRDLS